MPGADHQMFYETIISIIFRTYLRLGCPNGCNEGMQTSQADFLRVKVRNLLSQMHKNNPLQLSQMLNLHINTTHYQYLLDCIHAMTVFCQVENSKFLYLIYYIKLFNFKMINQTNFGVLCY